MLSSTAGIAAEIPNKRFRKLHMLTPPVLFESWAKHLTSLLSDAYGKLKASNVE
jgi:hypothetical protein